MTLYLLRALFVLMMAGIGFNALLQENGPFGKRNYATLGVAVIASLLVLAIDVFSSRRKLLGLSAILFGTLVGMLFAYILGLVSNWLVDQFVSVPGDIKAHLQDFLRLMLYVVCCYMVISFIMQTKDDIRFIIPYVAFAKQVKGARPLVLDTSVLIDGRIKELTELGLIDHRLVVPRFVLDELHTLADSSDRLRRNRGRRGLDILAKLQTNGRVDVLIYDAASGATPETPVDLQLVLLADEMDARILTTDFNLNKVAQLRGVETLNLNELAKALKPVVVPGDHITIQLIKPGEQPGQAVGYLEDGTMVVIEQARQRIGEGDIDATVTGIAQTSAGRIVFGRLTDTGGRPPARSNPPIAAQTPESHPS